MSARLPRQPTKEMQGMGGVTGGDGGGRVGDREGREYIRNELYGESTYPTILL